MTERANLNIQGKTLALSGILDYESVLTLDAKGQAWLKDEAPKDCVLDLTDVNYSSSAGIALVLGWMRQAQQHNKNLQLHPLPEDMAILAKVGGLEDVLAAAEPA